MGDRGNIVVRHEKDTNKADVWFYTQWRGSNIDDAVQAALARRQRWSDFSYLARIIFDTLSEDDHGSETGFGISTTMQDNEHDILVVDCPNQKVYKVSEDSLIEGRLPDMPNDRFARSFEQFIELAAK